MVIGAALAPQVNATRLVATLLAFFCAVGLAAHALDELHGRPLRHPDPGPVLVAVSAPTLAGAVAPRDRRALEDRMALVPFLVLGPLLVVAYNLEWFGGIIHTDVGLCRGTGGRSRC